MSYKSSFSPLRPASRQTTWVPDLLHPNSECAIHQSTWQYQADKCIDGNIDGVSGIGGNMCQSKEERSPWLAIDYGTPVIVQRVEIFNRDDCCGGRTKNVEVWISNHLLRTRNLLGTFVGPATDGQRITISGWRAYCTNCTPYWYI